MDYRAALVADGVPPMTAQEFMIYHISNPQVWKKFEEKASTLRAAGVKHYGAKAIMEVIRYEETIQRGTDGFKCNNNYTAYYARIWAMKHGSDDFFETREVRGINA